LRSQRSYGHSAINPDQEHILYTVC